MTPMDRRRGSPVPARRPAAGRSHLRIAVGAVSCLCALLANVTAASGGVVRAGSRQMVARLPSHVTFLAELRSAREPTCLEAFAARAGLSVQWTSGETWVSVTGTPNAVDRVFHVTVNPRPPVDGRLQWSATGTPVLPAAACGEIAGIGRIHSAVQPKMGAKQSSAPPGLSPSQLLTAYDASPLRALEMDGQGETVVVFEVDAYSPSDVNTFAKHIGAPLALTVLHGNPGKDLLESTMDIETIHEIVPDAQIVDVNLNAKVWANLSTAATFVAAFNAAEHAWPGSVWSLSIGVCETDRSAFDSTDLSVMQQAVSAAEQMGTTVFASSGDAGGLDCTPQNDSGRPPKSTWQGVSVPAALPAVTGCGGTSLYTTKSGQRVDETTWTETLLSQGSGGGTSTVFSAPSWQGDPVPGAAPGRAVPDVSADADPATGNTIVENGSYTEGGGTSLSTPIWAGFTAMIDQYLRVHDLAPVGFLNPLLYAIAKGPAQYPAFHDITVGGNDFFAAGPGYDMVTGLGSPDVWNLARDLAAVAGP